MARPKSLRTAKRRCWEAASKYIRLKHSRNGIVRCVTCDKTARYQDMHCGHYVHGLSYEWYDEQLELIETNLHPQCPGCNTYRGGMLDVYSLFVIDHYGRDEADRLQALRHKPVKARLDDYWDLQRRLDEQISNLTAGQHDSVGDTG